MKHNILFLIFWGLMLTACKEPVIVDDRPNDRHIGGSVTPHDSTHLNPAQHNPNNSTSTINAHREATKDSTLVPNDKTSTPDPRIK